MQDRARAVTTAVVVLVILLSPAIACAPKRPLYRPIDLAAWAVYYDLDRGLEELRSHGGLFDRVSLFAYELSSDGVPIPAPNIQEMLVPFLRLAEGKGFEPWLTVVNDVRLSHDSVVAKDSTVVHKLVAHPLDRRTHVRDLIARVADGGFRGLYLDYERVSESDAQEYRALVQDLSTQLQQRGLGLELVVEPEDGPRRAIAGVRVTIMAYDLFGTHSGPGPRSTPSFISSLRGKAGLDASGVAAVAIAVGGFAWHPDGEVESLDWSTGQRLAAEAPSRMRSAADFVPHASLEDGTELWFEDVESLLGKWEAASTAGFRRLAIWRLGGNDAALFEMIRNLRSGSDSS
jgi:spore germination protein